MFRQLSMLVGRIAKSMLGACGGLVFGAMTSLGTLTCLGVWELFSLLAAVCYTLLFVLLGMRFPKYFGSLLLMLVVFSVFDEPGFDEAGSSATQPWFLLLLMFGFYCGFFFMPFAVLFQVQELAALCLILIFQFPLLEWLHSLMVAKL